LPAGRARVFATTVCARLVITANDACTQPPAGNRTRLRLPSAQGRLDPARYPQQPRRARGLWRILIEGGPATVARFLESALP